MTPSEAKRKVDRALQLAQESGSRSLDPRQRDELKGLRRELEKALVAAATAATGTPGIDLPFTHPGQQKI